MNLEDVIRRRQDELRGRPRDWRDDLADRWQDFSLYDLVFHIWATIALIYCMAALVCLPVWLLFYR